MITVVSIPGIHCPSCAGLIKDVSGDFPAINSIDVNVETKMVTINHNESLDVQQWTNNIEALDPTYKVVQVS